MAMALPIEILKGEKWSRREGGPIPKALRNKRLLQVNTILGLF